MDGWRKSLLDIQADKIWAVGWTDRPTDRQTDRQTDKSFA